MGIVCDAAEQPIHPISHHRNAIRDFPFLESRIAVCSRAGGFTNKGDHGKPAILNLLQLCFFEVALGKACSTASSGTSTYDSPQSKGTSVAMCSLRESRQCSGSQVSREGPVQSKNQC